MQKKNKKKEIQGECDKKAIKKYKHGETWPPKITKIVKKVLGEPGENPVGLNRVKGKLENPWVKVKCNRCKWHSHTMNECQTCYYLDGNIIPEKKK